MSRPPLRYHLDDDRSGLWSQATESNPHPTKRSKRLSVRIQSTMGWLSNSSRKDIFKRILQNWVVMMSRKLFQLFAVTSSLLLVGGYIYSSTQKETSLSPKVKNSQNANQPQSIPITGEISFDQNQFIPGTKSIVLPSDRSPQSDSLPVIVFEPTSSSTTKRDDIMIMGTKSAPVQFTPISPTAPVQLPATANTPAIQK